MKIVNLYDTFKQCFDLCMSRYTYFFLDQIMKQNYNIFFLARIKKKIYYHMK